MIIIKCKLLSLPCYYALKLYYTFHKLDMANFPRKQQTRSSLGFGGPGAVGFPTIGPIVPSVPVVPQWSYSGAAYTVGQIL